MRDADLARLNQPYPEGEVRSMEDARGAVGVILPNWSRLQDEIFNDFVEEPPYGIGWWKPNSGTSRRILIADQLWCCLSSVPQNMTEAALHRLEYLKLSDRDSARVLECVQQPNGERVLDLPDPRSHFEQLEPDMIGMHQAGIVRSVASTLDCLAGVIIGVAALPQDILRADFRRVQKFLIAIAGNDSHLDEGVQQQDRFVVQMKTAIEKAGPEGWLDWVLDLRNMFVHRGRRLDLGQIVPVESILFGLDGLPIRSARRVAHLPRDPGRSDIEVWVSSDTPKSLVLQEEASTTLDEVIESTIALVETSAKHLLALWKWRRDHPDQLPQPAKQWPNGLSTQSTGFNGYHPGSQQINATAAISNPILHRRFRAAALEAASRSQWSEFD